MGVQQYCLRNKYRKNNFQRKQLIFFCLTLCLILYFLYASDSAVGMPPWEVSLPGDLATCVHIAPILLEKSVDEGLLSSKIFSWKTPRFADLLLSLDNQEGDNSIKNLINIICKPFTEKTKHLFLLAESKLNLPYLTSSHRTTFKVINKENLIVGNEIKLLIEAKDINGKPTSYGGGDFFKIRVENPETRSAVAASNIVDQGNGTYVVSIKTFWSGRNDIKVFFGQSGHFIDLIKRLTSRYFALELKFEGEYIKNCNKKKKHCRSVFTREFKSCDINRSQFDPKTRICNYSKNEREEWFCEMPSPHFTCSNLHAVYSKRNQNSLALFQHFPVNDRGSLKRVTLKGIPHSLNVLSLKGKSSLKEVLPACSSNLKTPNPAGYWKDGLWRSRVCKNFHYSLFSDSKKACLRNRVFYFIGDSTARQWFEYFIQPPDRSISQYLNLNRHSFKAREVTTFSDVWEPRTAVIDDLNTTFHYRCHGQPVQNGGLSYVPQFVSTTLDEIPPFEDGGAQLTIVMALGPHFFLYNPDVYLKRILASRDAALRLLSRNPKSTVIFKGTNTFIRGIGIGECCYSDWLSFRQHKLAKHVFDGTSIIYLDVWDMTVSHDSEDLIHPVSAVITNEIDMALSFTCSDN